MRSIALLGALHAATAFAPAPLPALRGRGARAPRTARAAAASGIPIDTCPIVPGTKSFDNYGFSSTIDRVLQSQRYPPKTCFEDEPVLQVARRLLDDGGVDGVSAALVYSRGDEQLVGIFTESDFLRDVPPPDCGEVVDEQLTARAANTVRARARRARARGRGDVGPAIARGDDAQALERARLSPSRR